MVALPLKNQPAIANTLSEGTIPGHTNEKPANRLKLDQSIPSSAMILPRTSFHTVCGIFTNMLLIVGTVRLPPQKLRSARTVMRCMVEKSRAEDGCEEYSYAEDVLDAGLIHVKEMWRDQAALDRHFASEHLAQ